MMVKAALAEPCVGMTTRTWPSVDDNADAKGDCVWAVIREADRWRRGTLPGSPAPPTPSSR
jgi:hypothetical protein